MQNKKTLILIILLFAISIPLAIIINEKGFDLKPIEEVENTTPLKPSNEFYSALVTDLPPGNLNFDEALELEENPSIGSSLL